MKDTSFLLGYLDKEAKGLKGRILESLSPGVKGIAKGIGPEGAVAGIGGVLATDNIDNPAQRGFISLLPALAASNYGRKLATKRLKDPTPLDGRMGQFMRGAGAVGGVSAINHIAGLAKGLNSEKGQDAMASIMDLTESAKGDIKNIADSVSEGTQALKGGMEGLTEGGKAVATTLGDPAVKQTIADTGQAIKDVSSKIGDSAEISSSFIQDVNKRLDPILKLTEKYKTPLLASTGVLTLAMIYNQIEKAREAKKNADLVEESISNIEQERKITARKERERLKQLKGQI